MARRDEELVAEQLPTPEPTPAPAPPPEPSPGLFRRAGQQLRRSPSLTAGLVILGIMVMAAALAPLLTPFGPFELDPTNLFRPPNTTHWFGTDELGRDIFTRSLFGARVSLLTGFFAVLGAAAVGVPLGLLSGYYGKTVDALVMRAIDVQIAVPTILLAMVVILLVGRGFWSTVVAVGIASIPAFARIARASTLAIKEEEYVSAVKALGGGHSYTMLRTILPNAMGPIIVQMVITAAVAVLLEAALSFLGLGTTPPTPSWGDMLRTSKGFLNNAPHYAVLPGVLLTITVVSLDLIGRGLQKMRGSSASAAADMESRA